MTDIVQFSFALSSRMRSFIELRDALSSLESARATQHGSTWLHAACDLRASLLGEAGRKNVIPEVIALFHDMQTHLRKLANDAPQYKNSIESACNKIDIHITQIQPGLPEACEFLSRDALINAYLNTQKKHDWLGHKLCMQQSIAAIWKNADARTQPLHQALFPLTKAVHYLNQMLNDFVQWKQCVAPHGMGQITPEQGKSFGLLVIGLPLKAVARGIMPDISGNRLAIRIRFQLWSAGSPPQDVAEDQPYSMMLIPIGL